MYSCVLVDYTAINIAHITQSCQNKIFLHSSSSWFISCNKKEGSLFRMDLFLIYFHIINVKRRTDGHVSIYSPPLSETWRQIFANELCFDILRTNNLKFNRLNLNCPSYTQSCRVKHNCRCLIISKSQAATNLGDIMKHTTYTCTVNVDLSMWKYCSHYGPFVRRIHW